MALIRITAPTVEPVSLREVKAQARVDISDDDALLEMYIQAAREHCEAFLRRPLVTQTWKLLLDDWPHGDTLEIPMPPLQSITSIVYTSDAGVDATFSSANYIVETPYEDYGRIRLVNSAEWPSTTLKAMNGIAVTFVCGYGDGPSSVPAQFRQAMLLLVATWYENREAILTTGAMASQIPFAVDALLRPRRAYKVL